MSFDSKQIFLAREAVRDYAREIVFVGGCDEDGILDIEVQRGEIGGKAFVALQAVLGYLSDAESVGLQPSSIGVAERILRGLDAL